MSSNGQTRRRAGAVMWAGIAGAALLLAVLVARGWGRDAWGLAGGLLLVVCLGVCMWAAVTGERSARAVREAVARLAEVRRQAVRPYAARDDVPADPTAPHKERSK